LYGSLGGPQGRSGRVRKISLPTGIWYPDRLARSESVYRLSYPGPHYLYRTTQKVNPNDHTLNGIRTCVSRWHAVEQIKRLDRGIRNMKSHLLAEPRASVVILRNTKACHKVRSPYGFIDLPSPQPFSLISIFMLSYSLLPLAIEYILRRSAPKFSTFFLIPYSDCMCRGFYLWWATGDFEVRVFAFVWEKYKEQSECDFYFYVMLFESWIFENFAGLHYNIAYSVIYFHCSLHLSRQSSSTLKNSMYCGPLEGIFSPLQPLAYGVPEFLIIGVFKNPKESQSRGTEEK
jgi:hypothetical protein